MDQLWLLHGLFTPLTLLLFLQLSRPRENALVSLGQALRALVVERGGRLVLAVMVVVTLFNFIQSAYDDRITEWLGYDFTAGVRACLLYTSPSPRDS